MLIFCAMITNHYGTSENTNVIKEETQINENALEDGREGK